MKDLTLESLARRVETLERGVEEMRLARVHDWRAAWGSGPRTEFFDLMMEEVRAGHEREREEACRQADSEDEAGRAAGDAA